jgi:hypothetical protein
MYHALGYGTIMYLQAVMTFDSVSKEKVGLFIVVTLQIGLVETVQIVVETLQIVLVETLQIVLVETLQIVLVLVETKNSPVLKG